MLTSSFESSSEGSSSGGALKGHREGVSEVTLYRWVWVGSYKGRRIPANNLYEKGLDVKYEQVLTCKIVKVCRDYREYRRLRMGKREVPAESSPLYTPGQSVIWLM